MPWDLLIRNGQCVLRDCVRALDLAIEDGKIVELKEGLHGSAKQEIDAAGLHIFPGVIDPHVHFNEPGRTDWEGFATGTAALAAGGGTCFFDMPLNSSPPTLDGPSFDLKLEAAKRSSLTDFGLWGGLTPKNLDRMEELAERGVVGFKAFMSGSGIDDFERADVETLRKGMEIASRLGLIVAVHAESEAITSRLTSEIRSKGRNTWTDYLSSRPIHAEVEAIELAVGLALATECRLHVVHVSSPDGVRVSNMGLRRGHTSIKDRNCTTETCPHYLLLNENDLIRTGANAKCAPPLRDIQSVRLMHKLLCDKIQIIGSDHSPAPESMKQGDNAFAIWGGISGVQSTLSALVTLGLSPPRVAELSAANAAHRFGIAHKGSIALGFDADFALVDIDHQYTLTREMLLDRHKLSPYVGRQFRGLVKRTISCGQTIFLDGKIVGKPRGRLITPMRKERA